MKCIPIAVCVYICVHNLTNMKYYIYLEDGGRMGESFFYFTRPDEEIGGKIR